jgi:hypothetical protein
MCSKIKGRASCINFEQSFSERASFKSEGVTCKLHPPLGRGKVLTTTASVFGLHACAANRGGHAHGLSVTALYRMLGLKQSSRGVGGLRVRKSLEARCHDSGPLIECLL